MSTMVPMPITGMVRILTDVVWDAYPAKVFSYSPNPALAKRLEEFQPRSAFR